VADKSTQLVLAALSQAAAAGPALLHPTRSSPGLFPASASGKQAARRCQEEGWLSPAPPDAEGTQHPPRYAITDAGFRHLLTQNDPRQVIEDFVRVLEARQGQAEELLTLARQMQASLATLGSHTRTLLDALRPSRPEGGLNGLFRDFSNPSKGFEGLLLEHLERHRDANASRDCPLPHLFGLLARDVPDLTLGRFHDALRRLHDAGAVYLHPWTGPLYEVPEPSCALLVGHEVAYYASARPA
jgi:hypothetical protein